jgi:hypothetical protein
VVSEVMASNNDIDLNPKNTWKQDDQSPGK